MLSAQVNISKTWNDLLNEPKVQDRDLPLRYGKERKYGKLDPIKGGLYDPTFPVVALILYIYQMENFVYSELNRSCRYKDESKVKTLGPYGMALGDIIEGA